MAIFPGDAAVSSDLLTAANKASTSLTSGINSSVTTIPVISTAAFGSDGLVWIENECIKYTGKTGTTFTGCTRAYDGTSAAAHSSGKMVYGYHSAAHHNVLKDEIEAIEDHLNCYMVQSGLLTGQTSEYEFGSLTLDANPFGSPSKYGAIRFTGAGQKINSNGDKILRVYIGSDVFLLIPTANNQYSFIFDATFQIVGSGSWLYSILSFENDALALMARGGFTESVTSGITVKVTGQLNNSSDFLSLDYLIIELLKGFNS